MNDPHGYSASEWLNVATNVVSASTTDGAEIIQWDCHGGTNQQWQLRDTGDGYLNRCPDVIDSSTANGTRLQQFDCRGAAGQQWRR